MDGMLSQEEIDALTGAASTMTAATPSSTMTLTDAERDAIGEIANINMGTAATTLSTLLNNKVTITTPKVSYVTINEISAQYDKPCVFIHISYIDGISGNNVLILKEHDVKVITDLMMGGDGSNTDGELTELHLSAISEAMNQMMGSAATSLSSMLDKKVDISPPTASVVDLNDSIDDVTVSNFLSDELVQVSFDMRIGDLVDSQIMQLYPFDFARDLYQKFVGEVGIGPTGACSGTGASADAGADSINAGHGNGYEYGSSAATDAAGNAAAAVYDADTECQRTAGAVPAVQCRCKSAHAAGKYRPDHGCSVGSYRRAWTFQ